MALLKTDTSLVDVVDAGANSAWVDVTGHEDIEVLIENATDRECVYRLDGAADTAGTGAQDISNGKTLTLPATTGKGILSLSKWPGAIRVNCNPSGGTATGTSTVRVLANTRRR